MKSSLFFPIFLNLLIAGGTVNAATDKQAQNQLQEQAKTLTNDVSANALNAEGTVSSLQNLLQASRFAASAPIFEEAVSFLESTCALNVDDDTAFVAPLPSQWLRAEAADNSSSETRNSSTVNDLIRRAQPVGKQYVWQSSISDAIHLDIYTAGPQQFYVLQIGENHPALQLRMSGDCVLVSARRIDYRIDEEKAGHGQLSGETGARLTASAIAILDSDGDLLDVGSNPQALNPPVPPLPPVSAVAAAGSDNEQSTGTVPVALIDSGVNYTLPAINKALLRDHSGALQGYDYRDDDAMPFDSNPRGSAFEIQRHGTQTASVLIAEATEARVAPFRFPAGNMHRMRELLAHIDELGIVLVGMPLGGNRIEEWQVFEKAASEYPHILFVASAGNNERDIDQQGVYPASLTLENLLVVSSADDTTLPAAGSNWGRGSVDYLLPAENIEALNFEGSATRISGSSYAVPRMLAVLVRLLVANPAWQAPELIKELRRRYKDGARARYVAGGYIGDPLSAGLPDGLISEVAFREITAEQWVSAKSVDEAGVTAYEGLQELLLSPEFIVLDDLAEQTNFDRILSEMTRVLQQCNIKVTAATIRQVSVADHLRSMSVGGARTWREQFRAQRPSIYLLESTRLLFEQNGSAYRFDAEAFGRGNTRNRDWLRDTVWLSKGIVDVERAVAHELMHVLMNSGAHVSDRGNLMNAETSVENWRLSLNQCEQARSAGLDHGLLQSQ